MKSALGRKTVLGRALRGLVLGLLATAASADLQAQKAPKKPKNDSTAKEAKPYNSPPIFEDSTPVTFTLLANYKQLKRERTGEHPYHPAWITYSGDSGQVRVPVRVRARGVWRRKNCEIPPLLLNFSKDSTKKTLFRHVDQLRLSFPCRNNDDFEQYVLQEHQLYRAQKQLTPYSFQTRLARVAFVDAENQKDTLMKRMAFLLEVDKELAERSGAKPVTTQGASGSDLDPYESALFGVFEYFVANTDFSITALHNVTLLFKDTTYVPVAYDFDWSGSVNTRYAQPAPQLHLRTVTDRLMRGYCTDPAQYDKVFALFRDKKNAIYGLYGDSLATGLRRDVVEKTLRYFDEFYETINDPRAARKRIVDACLRG